MSRVHLKVFAPTPKDVMPDVGEVGVLMVPEPPTTDQVPPPVVGVLPAKVAVVAQRVWSEPAVAVVNWSTVTSWDAQSVVLHVPLYLTK